MIPSIRRTGRTPDRVHHRVHRGVHQPGLAELADVQLDVRPLDPDQRFQAVGLAPAEPAAQLRSIQSVSRPGVAGQVRDRSQLRGGHRRRLERQEQRGTGCGGHGSPRAAMSGPTSQPPSPPTREAPDQTTLRRSAGASARGDVTQLRCDRVGGQMRAFAPLGRMISPIRATQQVHRPRVGAHTSTRR